MRCYGSILHHLLLLALYFIPPGHAEKACNNSPLLCNRKYNEITHLGAHDSPFVRNASNFYSIAGNQFYPTVTQLAAGVRLVSGQVHASYGKSGKEWHLCHSLCDLYDAGTLSGWLSGIKRWLDRNENEVVTILLVNADDASADDLAPEFEAANIVDYAYTPSDTTRATTDWPTLNHLISINKRLIVFIASLDPAANTVAPYLLDEFTFVFENEYDVTNPNNFSCVADRPDQYHGRTKAALASGRLPLMNHFMYNKVGGVEFPAVGSVQNTNAPRNKPGNLGDAADECARVYGSPPPLILVDFFNVGRAIVTVDRLNGVQGHITGRKHVSPKKRPDSRTSDPQTKPPAQSATKTPAASPNTGSHRQAPTSPAASHRPNEAPASSDHRSTTCLLVLLAVVTLLIGV